VICTLRGGFADTGTNARGGADYASLDDGLCLRTARFGTTNRSHMVLARLPVLHFRVHKTLAGQKATSMSGKAFVEVAANGSRWSATRRKERRGSGMHTR
jgi:hypothetical protein